MEGEKQSMVFAIGNVVGTLYLLTNSCNDAMDLVPTGENIVIGHHKFGQGEWIRIWWKTKEGEIPQGCKGYL